MRSPFGKETWKSDSWKASYETWPHVLLQWIFVIVLFIGIPANLILWSIYFITGGEGLSDYQRMERIRKESQRRYIERMEREYGFD